MACSSLPPAKRSCGKVMFLQACVILFTVGCLLPRGVSAPGGWGSAPREDLLQGGLMETPQFFLHFFAFFWLFFALFLHLFWHFFALFCIFKFFFCLFTLFPHHGQWAGGTHPTGMHSCFSNFYHLQREGVALGRGVRGSEGMYRG